MVAAKGPEPRTHRTLLSGWLLLTRPAEVTFGVQSATVGRNPRGDLMHRVPRLVTCTIAACAPVLGLVIAVAPNASASSSSSYAHALAAARAAIRHLSIGQHATDHAVGRESRIK